MLIPVTLKTSTTTLWLNAAFITSIQRDPDGGTLIEANKGRKNILYSVKEPTHQLIARLGVRGA